MGYRCPVCADPQSDGEHLANHLAFTAMLGGDDHEAWLDDHAPGWGDLSPPELAESVTDDAAETEFPQVFEDTTASHDHGRDDRTTRVDASTASSGTRVDGSSLDAETREILETAREMTRKRRGAGDSGDASSDSTTGDDRDGEPSE